MENYNGIAISKNDKEFVVAFDNFVNGKMQSATNTGKALATIHRYLQSQAFKVCVAYFRQLAVNYRTGYYDERNETAARRAAMMYDTLMNGDEIYDPINLYIPCNFLLAGDDVELRTEAEAGVHQMACAVWGRMQRRR